MPPHSDRIPRCIRDRSAGAGRVHVDVIAELQNVGTARTGITRRQYDLAGHLLLHIHVELLNSALLEVRILRQDGAGEIGRVGRRRSWETRDKLIPGVNMLAQVAVAAEGKRPIRRSTADSATDPARPDSRTNRGRSHSRREPRYCCGRTVSKRRPRRGSSAVQSI